MRLTILDTLAKILGIRFRVDGIPYGSKRSTQTPEQQIRL